MLLIQITLVHLRTVKHFLTDTRVQHAVDVVEARVRSLYETLSLGQWRVIRQALCSLFQDRRIKVMMALTQHPCAVTAQDDVQLTSISQNHAHQVDAVRHSNATPGSQHELCVL